MKKLVLYSRQSKVSDNTNQMTLETSEFTMKHYLDTLGVEGINYEIVDILREVKSGYGESSRNRKTFNKAVELCKHHEASLVVSNMSRLSRNTAHGAKILEEVDVIVASSPTANKAMKQIMLVMAEDESEQQSLRRKAVYLAKKQRCEETGERFIWGGASPKWKESMEKNKHNHKTTRLSEESKSKRQPVTQMIKDMINYSQNRLTLDEIASNLNSKGITTPQGKSFSKATVSRIIKQDGIDYKKKNKHTTMSA